MKYRALSIIVSIVVCLVVSSCTGIQNVSNEIPSKYDSVPAGESVIVDTARDLGVRPETIGNAIILFGATTIRIKGKSYKDLAIRIVTDLLTSLDQPLTYVVFKDKIENYQARYPELVSLIESYVEPFSANRFMKDLDRSILQKWLTKRLINLQKMEI